MTPSYDMPPVVPDYGPPPMPPFGKVTPYVVPPPPGPYEAPEAPQAPQEHEVYQGQEAYQGREAYQGQYDPHLGYTEPPEDPRRKGTLIAAVVSGLVVAAAGLGVGALWVQVAPRIGVVKVAQGFVYADAEPEQAIGADAWFAFLGLGAGALLTVLAWLLLRRYRGVAMMIGLVAGSLVAGWLAWWLGIRLGRTEFDALRGTAALGTRLDAPLVLRLTDLDRNAFWPPIPSGVIAAQALAAAITYTVLAGFSVHPGLRPPNKKAVTTETVSSDPDVPADPQA
jgi:MFS family permease